jgi:iron complex outermembrane receptor protein
MSISRLGSLWASASLVTLVVAHPAQASVTQVTDIRFNVTGNGVEIILETSDGRTPQVFTSQYGAIWVADVINAQLQLPDATSFEETDPITGIEMISVKPLDANSIRITVVGSAETPTGEVIVGDRTLTFNIGVSSIASSPETPQAPPEDTKMPSEDDVKTTPEDGTTDAPKVPDAPEDGTTGQDAIRIVVTGEQVDGSNYFIPEATTGTRTETPVLEVPQSVQVIPRQVLEDQQVTNLDEALRNVSGVTGSTVEGSGFRFSIRGFDRASILRNGFNLSASDNFGRSGFQILSETANLEQVEVLRGPASLLYGEINPGGVINLVTKQPLDEPFYEAEVQVGSREFFRPRIDMSGPLSSDGRFLYRLNTLFQNDGGFRDFDQNIERLFIAPVLTWRIGDRTDLTIELEYLNDERPYDTGTLAFGDGIIDIPRDQIVNEPEDFRSQETALAGYTFSHRFSENWQIRNGFRYFRQESDGRVAIPISFDEATGNLLRADASVDNFRESFALQTNVVGEFTTGPIGHTLLAGVDFSQTNANLFTGVNISSPLPLNVFDPVYEAFPRDEERQIPSVDEFIRTNRIGLYVQDQIALTDSLILVAGLRYDTINQTFEVAASPTNPQGDLSQNPDAFTPRVGLVYLPIPDLSLYASYSQSFTPNAGLTADGEFLEPEEGEGFEVGLKAELLNNRLFVNLAYFDITKRNVASPDPNFPTTPNVFVATGEERSRGLEFDLRGELLPGWNLIASYSLIDAEVTEDDITSDNRLPGIPRHSASLWTTYTIQSGSLEGLGAGIGFNYVGDREGDLANSFDMDSYFLTNAAIFYRRNNWRAAINFNNIFNVEYFQGTPFSRLRNIEVGEPFTVIGSISVQF